jgi:hypothetical protein
VSTWLKIDREWSDWPGTVKRVTATGVLVQPDGEGAPFWCRPEKVRRLR